MSSVPTSAADSTHTKPSSYEGSLKELTRYNSQGENMPYQATKQVAPPTVQHEKVGPAKPQPLKEIRPPGRATTTMTAIPAAPVVARPSAGIQKVVKRTRDPVVEAPVAPKIFGASSGDENAGAHVHKSRKVEPMSPESRRLNHVVQAQLQDAGAEVIVAKVDNRLQYTRDFDEEDLEDPAMCAQYAHEIMNYLMVREQAFMANPNYMQDNPSLDWRMRGIVVDWLAEVSRKFDLMPETMYLGVNMMDRFLSKKECDRDELQRVGLACMFIACKMEELHAPSVGTFAALLHHPDCESKLLNAERYVLEGLEFELWAPGPFSFIRRISKADQYDLPTRNLAKLLVELSLLDHRMLAYPASLVAAGCFYLARYVAQVEMDETGACVFREPVSPWGPFFVYSSGYPRRDVLPVAVLMAHFLVENFSGDDTDFTFFWGRVYKHELACRASFVVRELNLQIVQAKCVADSVRNEKAVSSSYGTSATRRVGPADENYENVPAADDKVKKEPSSMKREDPLASMA